MPHRVRWLPVVCAVLLAVAPRLPALAQVYDEMARSLVDIDTPEAVAPLGSRATVVSSAPLGLLAPPDAAGVLVGTGTLDPGDDPAVRRNPRLWVDVVVLGGGTTAYALAKPDLRTKILDRGSLEHVLDNFGDPIGRAVDARDNDPFAVNYVPTPSPGARSPTT